MDSSLLKTVLSSVKPIAKDSNASDKDVKSVLTAALPYLMAGKKTTTEQNKTVSKETGVDVSAVTSIIAAALPYVKEALKNVDADKLASSVPKLATPDNLKKAANLAGKLLNNKK